MSRIAELKALAKKPNETWLADLDYHCREIKRIMEAIHGGRVNYGIRHDTPMVMIMREVEGCTWTGLAGDSTLRE